MASIGGGALYSSQQGSWGHFRNSYPGTSQWPLSTTLGTSVLLPSPFPSFAFILLCNPSLVAVPSFYFSRCFSSLLFSLSPPPPLPFFASLVLFFLVSLLAIPPPGEWKHLSLERHIALNQLQKINLAQIYKLSRLEFKSCDCHYISISHCRLSLLGRF